MKYKVKETDKKIRHELTNKRLHQAIKNGGYVSPKQFADLVGIAPATVYDYLSCKICPIQIDGEFSKTAKVILEELCVLPQEVWDREDINPFGCWHTLDVEQSLTEFDLPYSNMLDKEVKDIFTKFTKLLSRRDAFIINCLVLDGQTMESIAKSIGITRERVRQIISVITRKFKCYIKSYEI